MSNPGEEVIKERLRQIPSVEKILESPELQSEIGEFSHPLVAAAVKHAVEMIRDEVKRGKAAISNSDIVKMVKNIIVEQTSAALKPVINAAGVILHTNLGRAPMDEETLSFIQNVSTTYSNLEFDLKEGKRSKRGIFVEKLLCLLTSAEAAMTVNNNAGAVLLILSALASGKEVIVSRGELVQIGGGFRIPEILALSGAKLKEVGTTNQTAVSDYEGAITPETAVLLKVHQSNFKMIGFVKRPLINELVKLGKKHNLCVVEDLGSGVLLRTEDFELAHEPTALEALSSGADLVCFSGDKLLGAPQAGIILGKKEYLDVLKKHPLHRALRLDKMFLAGLEKILLYYLKGQATDKIPVWQMISAPVKTLQARAEKIKVEFEKSGIKVAIHESQSTVGGGSLPGETLPTVVISVNTSADISADRLATLFREQPVPIIGRIENDKFVLDLRTVFPHQDEMIVSAIKNIFSK
ncbi:MAG: L-seryl-tRNA(Sec) selenium transferase [Candidatus Zixiibacteriota bacterium]|nr:MAG: L-seryl-tRNA(Sec) selenium transferase [candidate division Zixibacteria bacterium]